MRITEIAKPLVTHILSESLLEAKEGKNVHLEHLEDNIFNKGYAGAKEAIDYLYSLHNMLEGKSKSQISMTTKWDGAPAIVAGKDPETGKFFVGTKGVFATRKPKINYTTNDIKVNHPEQEELQSKLSVCLNTLSKLNWDTIAQGDMLWGGTEDGLQTQTINGEQYLTFTPNTITYAVPVNSDLAKKMQSAKMGIVWHTEYIGPTIADSQAKFGFDVSRLGNNAGVWHDDATIKDLSGTVTLTAQESAGIKDAILQADTYLKSIDAETFSFLEKGTAVIGDKVFIPQLKAHVNANIRNVGSFEQDPTKFAQGFVQKYIDYMTKEIDKVKTQKSIDAKTELMVNGVRFIKEHLTSIVAVYDLYLKLIEAKNVFVKKLGAIQTLDAFIKSDNGYEVTGEEGFVAVDRMGNALKLVDRLDFSKANFGTGKPGS